MRRQHSQVRTQNANLIPVHERTPKHVILRSRSKSGDEGSHRMTAAPEQRCQASILPITDLAFTQQPAAMSRRRATAAVAGTPSPFSSRVASLLVLTLAIGTSVAQAATYVSGQISTDQRWTTAMSPIILEADVAVWSDAGNTPVLTIDPGVTVKANAGTALIIGSGTWPGKLYALGTSASRISFTANGSTARGFWRGVYYDDGASDTSWQQYTNVTYAGGGGHLGAVQVNASKPTIKNTTVKYSSSCGLYLENGAAPVMSANSISYCTGAAMSFDPSCRVASVTSITGSTTNGTNAVEVRAGDLTGSNDTWKKLSIGRTSGL